MYSDGVLRYPNLRSDNPISTTYRKTVAVLAVAMLSAASVSAARALLDGGYCDWGGFDNPKYPWAKPRDERDWYCGNTAFFNSEAQGAADSGTVWVPMGVVMWGLCDQILMVDTAAVHTPIPPSTHTAHPVCHLW